MLWPSQVPKGNGKRDARQGENKAHTWGNARTPRTRTREGNAHGAQHAANAHQGEVARMSDERRQQIVDAARQLYEEQGLSATTVKDISERCGVARSLFYHYFR